MTDNEMKIILSFIDNATSPFKNALRNVGIETDKLKNKIKETGKTVRYQFKEASSSVRDFRRTMLIATIAMAAVVSSVREAAKYNPEAKKSFDDFTVAIQLFAVTAGQILIPAVNLTTGAIKILKDTLEAAITGVMKIAGFIDGIFSHFGDMSAADAIKYAFAEAEAAADSFAQGIEDTSVKVTSGITLETIAIKKQAVKAAKDVKEAIDVIKIEIRNWTEFLGSEITLVVDDMKYTLSGFFQDFFKGELKSAKEYFAEFGNSILAMFGNIIAEIITRWMVMKVITGFGGIFQATSAAGYSGSANAASAAGYGAGGSNLNTLNYMHKGGMIYAHNGLAIDEVPIIAQTGERVLSRKQNKAYEQGSGVTINVNQVIQAWDASDVYRNRKMLSASLAEEIKNNAGIRKIIKGYT
jgi:hypothetical protein